MNPQRSFRCVLAGSESLVIQCGEILRQDGHNIHGVIADEPAIVRWALLTSVSMLVPPPGDDSLLHQQLNLILAGR